MSLRCKKLVQNFLKGMIYVHACTGGKDLITLFKSDMLLIPSHTRHGRLSWVWGVATTEALLTWATRALVMNAIIRIRNQMIGTLVCLV
jgi:hypothetical protein